ncbi:MAG: hypothetical protein AB7D51_02600 [Desulfovibrionaceae bacterium]
MNVDRGWFLSVLALVGLSLLLLLASVWLSIERTNLAYGIEKLEKDIARAATLIAKLEVERDSLLSPDRLERLAKRHGLGPAAPGQIRRMDPKAAPGEPQTARTQE